MKPVIRYSALTLAACASIGLTGCKLSDLVDGDEKTSFVALQGTATTTSGPMIGARVDIKDANGNEFAAYVESSGYFSLVQDPDDEEKEYVELQAPLILSVDYNEETYRSVLCNIVYSQFGAAIDTVNVHPLTEFVMDETTGSVDSAYANWDEGASSDYCQNPFFVENFNNIASSLPGNMVFNPYAGLEKSSLSSIEYDSTFNFFNTLFSANDTGFDSVLRDFSPEMLIGEADEDFHLVNGLGSLVMVPGTSWNGTAVGSFGAEAIDESAEGIQIDITPEGLADTLEELLSDGESNVELQSLSISAEGNGIGEIGTTATVRLRGTAALAGAELITRKFDLTLDLVRVEGGGIMVPGDIIIGPQ